METPYVLEYVYRRSTGPVLGRFLAGLREMRVEGVRTRAGRVLVPPSEYDPDTGDDVTGEWVEVGPQGTVTTHAPGWALVQLDGADTAMLHRVEGAVATGARVRIRWRPERSGCIDDIACFEPLP